MGRERRGGEGRGQEESHKPTISLLDYRELFPVEPSGRIHFCLLLLVCGLFLHLHA